ncbi:MAG: response regulator [Aggregatilineales bacterium]
MFKVLVVDDEDGFRQIMQVVLQRAGYHVLQAAHAREALAILSHELPECIILDDMMPGMSGGALCQLIKSDVRLALIPVLMHTANLKWADANYIKEIGADGILIKPCSPREIVDAVSRFVGASA